MFHVTSPSGLRRPWVIAYVVISAALWTGGTVLVAKRSPGLIRERALPGPGSVEGMAEETLLYVLPAAAHWTLAVVDRPGRMDHMPSSATRATPLAPRFSYRARSPSAPGSQCCRPSRLPWRDPSGAEGGRLSHA